MLTIYTDTMFITNIIPFVFTNSYIHHMNVFECKYDIMFNYNNTLDKGCGSWKFMENKMCNRLIWSYDKGALPFTFPKYKGIHLTKPFLLLQTHYLLPRNLKDEIIPFESGFKMTVVSDNRIQYIWF